MDVVTNVRAAGAFGTSLKKKAGGGLFRRRCEQRLARSFYLENNRSDVAIFLCCFRCLCHGCLT